MAVTYPLYSSRLTAQLNEVYDRLERERELSIPPTVRSLIEDLIVESVSIRADEWRSQVGLDLNNPDSLLQTIRVAAESADLLMRDTVVDRIEGKSYLTLIETINALRLKWCGIFPFCRKR